MMAVLNISELLQDLGHDSMMVQLEARDRLCQAGSSVTSHLIGLLRTGTKKQIANAIIVLGNIGDPIAVDPLIEQLESTAMLFRMNAARALGEIGDRRAVAPLISVLSGDRELVQTWAMSSLGKLKDQRAVNPLLDVMERTESASLRYTAIAALGEIGDQSAAYSINKYRTDSDHHVQEYARKALLQLGYDSDYQTQDSS